MVTCVHTSLRFLNIFMKSSLPPHFSLSLSLSLPGMGWDGMGGEGEGRVGNGMDTFLTRPILLS